MHDFFEAWSPRVLSIFRIVAAALFLSHGTQKVLGFPAGPMPHGLHLDNLQGWSGLIELVGGALLLLGLGTRIVAFVLCGEMAVAYFQAHAPKGTFPIQNQGELAVIYCFVFLFFVFEGPGPWSIDALFRRKRRSVQ